MEPLKTLRKRISCSRTLLPPSSGMTWLNMLQFGAKLEQLSFLVVPLACCEARLNQSGCRVSVCVSVCGNFFPTNPYLKAGLTDLDDIWHDGRS